MSERVFGPDTVTFRVHTESTMFVAGIRALYLQALLPRAMWGVAQNSDYRSDTWGRLRRTIDYVVVTTFGTPRDAERAGARVRKIHAMLRAVDPDTGEEYRIDDPELLCFVHCAEIDSYLAVTRRAGLRLSVAEADRYVDEQRIRAHYVGLAPDRVPGSAAELAAYFAAVRPRLRLTPEAAAAGRFLLFPPMPPRFTPLRVPFAALSALAFATLPQWARRMYGALALPATIPTTDLAATAALRAVRGAAAAVPDRWRHPVVRRARVELAARVGAQRAASAAHGTRGGSAAIPSGQART